MGGVGQSHSEKTTKKTRCGFYCHPRGTKNKKYVAAAVWLCANDRRVLPKAASYWRRKRIGFHRAAVGLSTGVGFAAEGKYFRIAGEKLGCQPEAVLQRKVNILELRGRSWYFNRPRLCRGNGMIFRVAGRGLVWQTELVLQERIGWKNVGLLRRQSH